MKNSIFEFTQYNFLPEKKKITFSYAIHGVKEQTLRFTETVDLPRVPLISEIPQSVLDALLRDLHLILGISYYKMFVPKAVKHSYALTREQASFWNTVYQTGLGEFLYRNKLDPRRMARFSATRGKKAQAVRIIRKDRSLVGIGGGKDSIVTAELLKQHKHPITSFHVEAGRSSMIVDNVIKKVGVPKLLLRRNLDPQLLQGIPGAYNGHVPVSLMTAFLGFFSALIYDYRYVVVSNEQSSNFGNITYRGITVNHQWSKSGECEALFQRYAEQNITPSIVYYSLLRPFHEIRIAKMFTEFADYFPIFSSCNRSFRITKQTQTLWCGECPKCAFVFLMLAPFISRKKLTGIFGKNLLDDPSLIALYRDLLGVGTLKPFDCVGTFEESRVAFNVIQKKYAKSAVVQALQGKISSSVEEHYRVFAAADAPCIPARFRFLGIKSTVLLGYGAEGKVTETYLRSRFPYLKITRADEQTYPKSFQHQNAYELAVKSPGIIPQKVKIPYTTATNIFLSEIQNTVIGITGTKGKSTTASLIAHILRTAKKRVELVGNIGSPMLASALRKVHKDTIFVVELSSYQLQDIQYSPHVALILNLFPEHMNYHGSVEAYYHAKEDIVQHQVSSDVFLYSHDTKRLTALSKKVSSRPLPFMRNIAIQKTALIGRHNIANIRAAATCAQLFGVDNTTLQKALATFTPLPHRLQNIGTFGGVTFYDDAISTTPQSTMAAIEALGNVATIFLGGEDRGYDFHELEKLILKRKIANVVLFPDTGTRMFQKSHKNLTILRTKSMREAVRFAYQYTPPGSICLLSTASPSYTLWKNFEAKGSEFAQWVEAESPKSGKSHH